jgi:predicted TIM-barrel fold metal-dependent hydrolase
VLFATDYPLIAPGTFIRRLEAARMPTATLRRILGGNAWRILKLGERAKPSLEQAPREART